MAPARRPAGCPGNPRGVAGAQPAAWRGRIPRPVGSRTDMSRCKPPGVRARGFLFALLSGVGGRHGADVARQASFPDPQVNQVRDGADHPDGVPVQRVALHEQGADVPALQAADFGPAVAVDRAAPRPRLRGRLGFGALWGIRSWPGPMAASAGTGKPAPPAPAARRPSSAPARPAWHPGLPPSTALRRRIQQSGAV